MRTQITYLSEKLVNIFRYKEKYKKLSLIKKKNLEGVQLNKSLSIFLVI